VKADHHLPLSLVLPEVAENLFLVRIIQRLKGTFCAFYAFCAVAEDGEMGFSTPFARSWDPELEAFPIFQKIS